VITPSRIAVLAVALPLLALSAVGIACSGGSGDNTPAPNSPTVSSEEAEPNLAGTILLHSFTSWRDRRVSEILTLDLDGGQLRNVTPFTDDPDWPSQTLSEQAGSVGDEALSPDARQIAFTNDWLFGPYPYVMTLDGGDARWIGEWGYWPAWSPDGQWLAYQDDHDLYVAPADGQDEAELLVEDQIAPSWSGPSWSPDGREIAFGCDGAICVVNVEDGSVSELTAHLDYGVPSWSPDGERIAFAGVEDPTVLTMNRDGTDTVELAPDPDADATFISLTPWASNDPWAPEGGLLAFLRSDGEEGGRLDLWVSSPDGSGQRVIAEGLVTSFAWSPDGTAIAYTERRLDSNGEPLGDEIYVAWLDGGLACKVVERVPGGTVFVADWGWGTAVETSPARSCPEVLTLSSATVGGEPIPEAPPQIVEGITALAIDEEGVIYLAGDDTNNVVALAPNGDAEVVAGLSDVATSFPYEEVKRWQLRWLALDGAGTLFAIGHVTVDGYGYPATFRVGPSEGATELSLDGDFADQLVRAPDGSMLLVVDQGRAVYRVELDGTLARTEVDWGAIEPARPTDVAIDTDGSLYYAVFGETGILLRIDQAGQAEVVLEAGDLPVDDARSIVELAVAPDGVVWLMDNAYRFFTFAEHAEVRQIASVAEFADPWSVAGGLVAGPEGELYARVIFGLDDARIIRISRDGTRAELLRVDYIPAFTVDADGAVIAVVQTTRREEEQGLPEVEGVVRVDRQARRAVLFGELPDSVFE
jgi:Tol biopolymer transport system component